MRADAGGPAPRTIGEYVVLASLFASLAYWGYLIVFGQLTITGATSLVIAQIAVFLGLGATALVLLLKRRASGAWFSLVFYAVQLLELVFASGNRFNFNSLPTIYWRVFGSESVTINLNLLSLVLFVFSCLLLGVYRGRFRADS